METLTNTFWNLVKPCSQCMGSMGFIFKTEDQPVQLVEELNVFNAEFSEDDEEPFDSFNDGIGNNKNKNNLFGSSSFPGAKGNKKKNTSINSGRKKAVDVDDDTEGDELECDTSSGGDADQGIMLMIPSINDRYISPPPSSSLTANNSNESPSSPSSSASAIPQLQPPPQAPASSRQQHLTNSGDSIASNSPTTPAFSLMDSDDLDLDLTGDDVTEIPL